MTRICKRSLRVLSLLRAACFHLCRNGKKLGNGVRMMVACQGILRASDWKEKVKANILRISELYGAILWEQLLYSSSRRSHGRQYWGLANIEGSQREKRDRKSLLKPHLSGIMWIDIRPTFQHFEFHIFTFSCWHRKRKICLTHNTRILLILKTLKCACTQ